MYYVYTPANANVNSKIVVLIHGGGWKKLEKESISDASFRDKLRNQFGIQATNVAN